MLNNPFLKKEESLEQQKEFLTHSIEQKELEFSDDFSFDSEDSDKTLPFDNNDTYHSEPTFEASAFDKYQPKMQFERELKRDLELNDEEYHQRLLELNTDAENKHYVLFFGQPASGKIWIIGSLLHYMKNYLGGTV